MNGARSNQTVWDGSEMWDTKDQRLLYRMYLEQRRANPKRNKAIENLHRRHPRQRQPRYMEYGRCLVCGLVTNELGMYNHKYSKCRGIYYTEFFPKAKEDEL